jgi:membrane-associated phospholipid phosphatase
MAIWNELNLKAWLKISKRLTLSYILDWLIIILIAGLGGIFNYVKPYHRPFSLLDLSISFPIEDEIFPVSLLVIICGLAPAVLIALIVLIFVPGPRFNRSTPRAQVLRLKLWEWEKGWAGFCLSLAIGFFITQGMKNLFGKPRPNLLARCKPNLTDIAAHVVGGYGQDISARWTLVSSTICTQTDMRLLDDGFRSFPSGHSSFSWSAMLYLSLFLCSKFAIAIPFLPNYTTPQVAGISGSENHQLLPLNNEGRYSTEDPQDKRFGSRDSGHSDSPTTPIRNRAAAPPNHLIIVAFLPIGIAIWITSTRFVEFYHFGFDMISGALIGIGSAWFAFRWYHLPVRNGQGWAWGARSRDRAFGIAVGTNNSYVGDEGWDTAKRRAGDLESAVP